MISILLMTHDPFYDPLLIRSYCLSDPLSPTTFTFFVTSVPFLVQ